MTTKREAQLLLSAYQSGITSQQELAIFMAQVGVESGDLRRLNEGFVYSRSISQITEGANVRWALREGPDALESARVEAIRGQPERLAELMYGGRMGNNEPGDGYKYHGRGYIQLTGKNQYRAAGEALGLDLVNQPELAAQPEHASKIAILFWKTNVPAADRENVTRAGGAINTGDPNGTPNHADRRMAKYQEWSRALTPEVMESLSRGETIPVTEAQIQQAQRSSIDSTVRSLQQNLNTLGIRDARDQPLSVDGDRGNRTNDAIAAFQREAGLSGEMSNADLLIATQATLDVRRALGTDQALRRMLPENMRAPERVGSMPHYLVPGRSASGQTTAAAQAPTTQSRQADTTPAADVPVRLPPMPPVEQLQPGASGAAVFALQEHLRLLNARDAEGRELKPDRDYGPRTQEAVENFQLWAGLATTGIADRATLDALKTHAAHAMEQRANGIPLSDHLADNLKRGAPDAAVATGHRPTPGQATAETPAQPAEAPALLPYSDPSHPKHALYAEVKAKVEGMGYHLPEDRLHQITGQMDMAGMRAGPQNQYAIRNDNNTFYAISDIPGFRAHQNLSEPTPPIEQTMQQVTAHQQAMEREMSRAPDSPDRGAPGRSL